MDLAYGRHLIPSMAGLAFRNARFFAGPEEGATTVYVDGDYPLIQSAYEARGVKVLRLDAAPVLAPVLDEAQSDRPAVDIPADWRELGWSQPDERGLTLRSLASQVSAEPIINKAQAVAAIEAYLGVTVSED
jgi:hypothetical protein